MGTTSCLFRCCHESGLFSTKQIARSTADLLARVSMYDGVQRNRPTRQTGGGRRPSQHASAVRVSRDSSSLPCMQPENLRESPNPTECGGLLMLRRQWFAQSRSMSRNRIKDLASVTIHTAKHANGANTVYHFRTECVTNNTPGATCAPGVPAAHRAGNHQLRQGAQRALRWHPNEPHNTLTMKLLTKSTRCAKPSLSISI